MPSVFQLEGPWLGAPIVDYSGSAKRTAIDLLPPPPPPPPPKTFLYARPRFRASRTMAGLHGMLGISPGMLLWIGSGIAGTVLAIRLLAKRRRRR